MISNKMVLIQDAVHGVIPISSLDKYIISTKSFNRLHNILQNSLAYFVYPSNKTSRFVHSLGVAHLSSLVFKNSFLNADEKCINTFFKKSDKLIKKIFNSEVEKIKNEFKKDKLVPSYMDFKNIGIDNIDNSLYNYLLNDKCILSYVPGNINGEYIKTYMFLLQGLRFASLLHDIGHLPLSHLLEFVLESYYDKLKVMQEKGSKLNETQKYILEVLETYIKNEKLKMHEKLSKKLIYYIFTYEIIENLEKMDEIETYSTIPLKDKIKKFYQRQVLFRVFRNFVIGVLFEYKDDPILTALHKIISGDFDVDRIDYIIRDGVSSGLLSSSGNIERVIKLYSLVCYNEDYLFTPSIRALKDIEEMLIDRFNLYKYMYFHHKVILLEYLVEKILLSTIDMETKYLNKDNIGEENVSYIFKIMDLNDVENEFDRKKMYDFFKLDDFWLMYILRKQYILYLENENNYMKDNDVGNILGEFFSRGNEMALKSLWKRDDEFYEFIKKYVIESNLSDIIDKFDNILNNYNKNLPFSKNEIDKILENIKTGDFERDNNETIYKFLYLSYKIFEKSRRGITRIISKLEEDANSKTDHKIYICPYPYYIKISISNLRIYDSKEGVIELSKISNIGNYLSYKHYSSPFFNIYLDPSAYYDDRVKKEIGKLLIEHLYRELEIINNEFK